MSVFNNIGNFFKKLFHKLRPGLDEFLQKYKDLALAEVRELAKVNNNQDFHHWKDTAWQALNDKLKADGKTISGNWISLITHLAYEEIKGELLAAETTNTNK